MTTFSVETFVVAKYDSILSRGLSNGMGEPGKQVCIEAAICEALGLPHGDDPQCVAKSVRSFKITLNDSRKWNSPESRAMGLRDLGLAQLGSIGVINDYEFTKRMAEKTIRVLIPTLFRNLFQSNTTLLEAADRCEKEGTVDAASYAAHAAYAADAVSHAAYGAANTAAYAAAATYGAATHTASYAAHAASYAANAADSEEYLLLSAKLALKTLKELNSPGCALLT